MWHIVTTFWFTVCVFCWLMTCVLSIFSVLDNFCQISPLHRNAVWITRVLHLICNAHTHILLFGSKFHIILAMYVQMLDICIENIENIETIENIENIGYFRYFWYFRKYHDIFQPWGQLYGSSRGPFIRSFIGWHFLSGLRCIFNFGTPHNSVPGKVTYAFYHNDDMLLNTFYRG